MMVPSTVSIDLSAAARRSDDLPEGWDEARIARAVSRYERFLTLAAEAPCRPIAPTRDIDVIWHLHMLHPVAYQRDCVRLFGQLLDHDGGFGKDPSELPELIRVFEDTSRRWRERFGEDYVEPGQSPSESMTKCWHDCQGRCWHACKSDVQ